MCRNQEEKRIAMIEKRKLRFRAVTQGGGQGQRDDKGKADRAGKADDVSAEESLGKADRDNNAKTNIRSKKRRLLLPRSSSMQAAC
jgi:hypothetical protein